MHAILIISNLLFQIATHTFLFIKISMNILKTCLLLALITASFSSSLSSSSPTASGSQIQECGPGGVICPSGTCHYPTYIQGCYIYSSSTSCFQCQYNYVKSGNVCTYSPPSDISSCCVGYLPNGLCSECAKGLILSEGKCIDKKIIGCLIKTKTGSCINCAIQYALLGGVCIKKIGGCRGYKGTGVCEDCEEGFELVSGGYCIKRGGYEEGCRYPWKNSTGVCAIQGCNSVSDFGCGVCKAGYRLLPDGACKMGTIQGCQQYAPDGFCQICKRPFYVESPTGFCLSFGCIKVNEQGKCTGCDSSRGFQMGSDGYCYILNCLVSNAQECLICDKGYLEVYGKCQKQVASKRVCTVCAKNFYQTESGQCKSKQPGCISYNRYKCSECEPNLYLSQNYQCLPKQKGCIYKDGLCLECLPPFKKSPSNPNRCQIQGCLVYSETGCKTCTKPYISQSNFCGYKNCMQVQNGKCLKCFEGYAISYMGFCYETDPFCKAYDVEGRCIECQIGYYGEKTASGFRCRQQKFGCNYLDGKCVSCRAPFEFNSKDQSCVIDGCLTYFLGGCQTCQGGYDLRYNSCKLPFCLISYKGHCSQCDPNYILKSDGTCVNKDEFCWKYDNNGNCLQCAPEYFLSKLTNKCKPRQPGCQYNDQDRCYACDKPFYFDGVRCQIYGCMKLSFKGCDQCFYPRQATKNGLCSVQNCDRMEKEKCVICKPGFMIATDGSCQVEDPQCLVYCQKGCNKCVKGYRVDRTGRCEYADEHCWDFSQQGHCTNCDRLYFLNIHNKCQLKDSNCAAYSGGRCVQCKNYFYLHRGLCYPNAKGCLKQKNIKNCQKCQSGYKLDYGVCTPEITRLSWDSVNMDFWNGESDQVVQTSKQVFSIGKTNKYNLDGAIVKGKGKIIYSSVVSGRKSFQVDDDSQINGWTPSSSKNEFIGVLLDRMQTFYALDIKYIAGSTLSRFAIEQSDNGVSYRRIQEFKIIKMTPGTVQTFYFTPVHSKSIRLVSLQGTANIKIEFYYSNGQANYPTSTAEQTYIASETSQSILDSLRGELFSTKQGCVDKDLCWTGIQLCQPKQIQGFTLIPNQSSQSKGSIESVTIRYSLDGVKFLCYQECNEIKLVQGGYRLNPRVNAIKLRVYPSKWQGNPEYGVSFQY